MRTDLTYAVIEESIRELNKSDRPDLYHLFRRWAREHIKRQAVEPIDVMNWPKGCLIMGLLHQARLLSEADNSKGRATAIRCLCEVKDYFDRWMKEGSHIYMLDDCLAGQGLLWFSTMFDDNEKYLQAADSIMVFLKNHKKDLEGTLPYRPAHADGRIFADGIGMAMPFAFGYGVLRKDEEAIELGMNQLRGFISHGIDSVSGFPWHAYSITQNGDTKETLGALGWGRAAGWIMLGLRSSLDFLNLIAEPGVTVIKAKRDLKEALDTLSGKLIEHARTSGLFGSIITDEDSPVDTSASAMILYGLMSNAENENLQGDVADIINNGSKTLSSYVTQEGLVLGAQGECIDLGVYSETYDSYSWSVGTALLVLTC